MTQFTDRAELSEATEFIRRKLSACDLSKLDKLTLASTLRSRPLNWRVKLPHRVAKGSRDFKHQFIVYCSVIGGSNLIPEEGFRLPVVHAKELNVPPELSITFRTRAEMLVFAAGAGCYHYLRRTKQVPGVARNSMARRYACGWVAEFSPRAVQFLCNRPASYSLTHPHYTCFGVEIPSALVNRDEESLRFFEYHVEPYVFHEGEWDDVEAITASMRLAIARSIDATFDDCDAAIVSQLKAAENPLSAWLILADWLEERGDPRAAWIRSHRLDIVEEFDEEIRRRISEARSLTRPSIQNSP